MLPAFTPCHDISYKDAVTLPRLPRLRRHAVDYYYATMLPPPPDFPPRHYARYMPISPRRQRYVYCYIRRRYHSCYITRYAEDTAACLLIEG